MKLKSKPTARIKKRYLLIEGKKEEIEKAVLDYLGILGYAKASPIFINTRKKERVILAINRAEINNVRAAFELSPSKMKVITVSGTIKGLS